MQDPIERAAEAIKKAERAIAVTGAGISAESGVPTFRDPGGIWEKYPPEEYAGIHNYLDNPEKVWEFWKDLSGAMGDIKPNPGHKALAELEGMNRLDAVITQNVDNLHEDAGSKTVIEYHGNARYLACMQCGHREPLDIEDFPQSPPHCVCGGLMKPDVVMFGEMIPQHALLESESLAQKCDLCIIVGTSAQVFPAAQVPITAQKHGAVIIEANTEETDFTNYITDIFLEGPCGQTLPKVLEHLKFL